MFRLFENLYIKTTDNTVDGQIFSYKSKLYIAKYIKLCYVVAYCGIVKQFSLCMDYAFINKNKHLAIEKKFIVVI